MPQQWGICSDLKGLQKNIQFVFIKRILFGGESLDVSGIYLSRSIKVPKNSMSFHLLILVMVTGYSDENLPDAVNVDIGISISLIVAIAVVIGALILTIGLVCFKRSVLIEFIIQDLQKHDMFMAQIEIV